MEVPNIFRVYNGTFLRTDIVDYMFTQDFQLLLGVTSLVPDGCGCVVHSWIQGPVLYSSEAEGDAENEWPKFYN